MMNKFLYAFFILLGAHMNAFGQMHIDPDKEGEKQELSDRFFMAITYSAYLDVATSKVQMLETSVPGVDAGGNSVMLNLKVPHQTRSWSILSVGIEPRFNLHELDVNTALAVSMPISFALAQTQPVNDRVRGIEGVGAIQIPLLLKLYAGNHATLYTEKNFGISIGGGFEYNKIGLLDVSSDIQPVENKGWIMPVATFGIHFWRGIYPMEINVKYGASSYTEYYINKYGDPLLDDFGNPIVGRGKASSFKISFVSLLNY